MSRLTSSTALWALVALGICALTQTAEARDFLEGNVTVGGSYQGRLPRRGALHRVSLVIPDGDYYVIEAKFPRGKGDLHMFASCMAPPSRYNYEMQAKPFSTKQFTGVALNIANTNCTAPYRLHVMVMAYKPTDAYDFYFRRLVSAQMLPLVPVHREPEERGEKLHYSFEMPETWMGERIEEAQVVVEMTDTSARYNHELQVYVRRGEPATLSRWKTRIQVRDHSKPRCSSSLGQLVPGETYYVLVDNWSGFAYRLMVQFNPFNCDFDDATSR